MANPTVTKLRKIATKKRRQIELSEKRLKESLKRLQFRLNAFMIKEIIPQLETDENGNIRKTKNNAVRLKANERLRKLVNNDVQKELRELFNKEYAKIKNATDRYFREFNPTRKQQIAIKKQNRRLITIFKKRMIANIKVNTMISSLLSENIKEGANIKDLRKDMTDFITGRDRLGVLEHEFWQKDGLEQFQVHARSLSQAYSKKLSLDYAIYAGGEILTTREFCDERNGQVFTREEIASWQSEEWQGKKKNHNIFIDVGGYNCRHEYDWISFELAVRLRPDLKE